MRRESYAPSTEIGEHAGLFLLKGFKKRELDGNGDQGQDSDGNHNKAIAEHHRNTANKIPVPGLYTKAYDRWKVCLIEQDEKSCNWFGKLVGRLYLGMGEASPLEAGITLHHTYGVPFIPGSAVKGVLHHFAIVNGIDSDLEKTIFGVESKAKEDIKADAGYVIFNDAWWIPGNGSPLVPEVVTVHHQNYYKENGAKPATDFDDPNPNPQIAIRGSFHFSFLADKNLHNVVRQLLEDALQHYGIGGKTSSGYGLFTEDTSSRGELDKNVKELRDERIKGEMSPLEREIYEIEQSSNNSPSMALLNALEDGRWPDEHDRDTAARRIQEIMRVNKEWKEPNSNVTGKKGVKLKKRCLKVMSYFLENQGK